MLEAGSEDYFGLYEVSRQLPAASSDLQRLAAAVTLQFLAAEGLVEIFRGRWELNDFRPVPQDRLAEVLADPNSWAPPRDLNEPVYVFTNTDEGDAAYEHGRFRS